MLNLFLSGLIKNSYQQDDFSHSCATFKSKSVQKFIWVNDINADSNRIYYQEPFLIKNEFLPVAALTFG
jgi:hypothetical protein